MVRTGHYGGRGYYGGGGVGIYRGPRGGVGVVAGGGYGGRGYYGGGYRTGYYGGGYRGGYGGGYRTGYYGGRGYGGGYRTGYYGGGYRGGYYGGGYRTGYYGGGYRGGYYGGGGYGVRTLAPGTTAAAIQMSGMGMSAMTTVATPTSATALVTTSAMVAVTVTATADMTAVTAMADMAMAAAARPRTSRMDGPGIAPQVADNEWRTAAGADLGGDLEIGIGAPPLLKLSLGQCGALFAVNPRSIQTAGGFLFKMPSHWRCP